MDLLACLPQDLQAAVITPITAGLSGAGVYRVEHAGETFVLKISSDSEAECRRKLIMQRLAADAGLAPRIVHADEGRRAVLSAFVADRSFPAFFMNPQTRDAAIAQLGRTVRRVHDLPLPPDAIAQDPRALLATLSAGLAGFAVPEFVRDAVQRVLDQEPPRDHRALVLSHNDLNPGNLVFDGTSILIVDWNTAGPMHPYYDLATISVFLRMDDPTARQLLAAHDGMPIDSLPAQFGYLRRLAAVACGAFFLHRARQMNHPGGPQSLDATLSLADFYQRMRTGELAIGSAEGQWAFGLALVKEAWSFRADSPDP